MQRIWYDCWSSTTSNFSDSKVHIRQRGKDFGCFNIKHYREPLLIQVAIEIPCQVTVEMSLIFRNGQLLDCLIELVEVVYSEPMPPIILHSFLADEIEVECVSNEICKANSWKAEERKNWQKRQHHMTSETCFVVKMKQTPKGWGLQIKTPRWLLLMIEIELSSEYKVFLCFVLVKIWVSHLTNCRSRLKKYDLFYLFRWHFFKKLCKFGSCEVENNKKRKNTE